MDATVVFFLVKMRKEQNQTLSVSFPPALGQIMLYVDGMNGLISHNETVQWLYTLVGSKVRNMNISLHHNRRYTEK